MLQPTVHQRSLARLVPGIHVFTQPSLAAKAWVAGKSQDKPGHGELPGCLGCDGNHPYADFGSEILGDITVLKLTNSHFMLPIAGGSRSGAPAVRWATTRGREFAADLLQVQ